MQQKNVIFSLSLCASQTRHLRACPFLPRHLRACPFLPRHPRACPVDLLFIRHFELVSKSLLFYVILGLVLSYPVILGLVPGIFFLSVILNLFQNLSSFMSSSGLSRGSPPLIKTYPVAKRYLTKPKKVLLS